MFKWPLVKGGQAGPCLTSPPSFLVPTPMPAVV